MITKIHPPHDNLAVTLRYNFKKVEEDEAKVLYTRNLSFPSTSEITFSEAKEKMYGSMPSEYRTNNIVFHASINPHITDKLNEVMMEYFIDDYMEELGYGSQPYIVFKHEDIDRIHYHVVSLNVDKNGRKIDDSFIKRRSWQILQKLSQKYGIIPPNKHLKEERDELIKNAPQPIIYKEGDLVNKIKRAVNYAMEVYRPKSIGELSAILIGYNIRMETVKNSHTQEEDGGLLFSIIDEENNRQSVGIKASELGYFYTKKQLGGVFKENKRQWKKERANRIKYAIPWALRNTKDPVKFVSNMRELGINALLRFSKDGRIYGVTFIDTKRGNVCNGSDIGKEYSANTLETYFNGETSYQWSVNPDRSYHIEKAISQSLKEDLSLDEFVKEMEKRGIEVMVERNKDGGISNFVFADNKHYSVMGSDNLSDHYSTILLRNYFEEDGVNFWSNDSYNIEYKRALWEEKHLSEASNKQSSDSESFLDDMIDAMENNVGGNRALAIAQMYQRQAERNWGKIRRR
ncbi:relaxase/mobilization nuclease domain-containing protein [Porphyromonas levii]|uniref:relaxase/mobilization nuclease domain-containing protein n=1 Tax=Porphyromonas levii TaxID=28114 RepID=UPI000364D16D|nr:relaxase/mobilization nuclease domain-containing protein [Porphyromonas levii]